MLWPHGFIYVSISGNQSARSFLQGSKSLHHKFNVVVGGSIPGFCVIPSFACTTVN